MAYYKGREVSVASHIPVEYKVLINHKDGTPETVNLLELVMSKREIVSFVKGEMDRIKSEEEKVRKEEESKEVKLAKEARKVKETQDAEAAKEAEVVKTTDVPPRGLNPFAPRVVEKK
jgi:hypothetical protein